MLLTAYGLPKLTHVMVHMNNSMVGNKEELWEDHRAQSTHIKTHCFMGMLGSQSFVSVSAELSS